METSRRCLSVCELYAGTIVFEKFQVNGTRAAAAWSHAGLRNVP